MVVERGKMGLEITSRTVFPENMLKMGFSNVLLFLHILLSELDTFHFFYDNV